MNKEQELIQKIVNYTEDPEILRKIKLSAPFYLTPKELMQLELNELRKKLDEKNKS